MHYKMPQFATKVAEKYVPERDLTFKVYRWYASHGYQTDFKAVEHLAISVIRHSDQKILISKSTTSQKTIQEWIGLWQTQFGMTI
jgi:hypothetical protein